MSHRTALAASIVLTLIVALGILTARDRFFGAQASTDTAGASTATTVVETVDVEQQAVEAKQPRQELQTAVLAREKEDASDQDEPARPQWREDEDDDDD